jgi:hypothetical protein
MDPDKCLLPLVELALKRAEFFVGSPEGFSCPDIPLTTRNNETNITIAEYRITILSPEIYTQFGTPFDSALPNGRADNFRVASHERCRRLLKILDCLSTHNVVPGGGTFSLS